MLQILRNLAIVTATVLGAIAIIYLSIPMSDTQQSRFDVILVLGHSSSEDGTPSRLQRACVEEAVRQYRAGVAPHMVFTGGAAHNRYVEAHVMAELARTSGVPASAILEEPQALNTLQNAWYSYRILQAHDWRSALVVTIPSHVRRAGLILRYYPIAWRMDAAPWPTGFSISRRLYFWMTEALYTSYVRIAGFPGTQYLPRTHFQLPRF